MTRNGSVNIILTILLFTLLFCCKEEENPNAYGNFEAREWTIPSGGSGKIISMNFEEGDKLTKNQIVGLIDTTLLHFRKLQVEARIKIILSGLPDISLQLDVLKQKKAAIEKEQKKINNLVEAGSLDQKKLDEINDKLEITKKEIKATKSNLEKENAGRLGQIEPLRIDKDLINEQISRCIIRNPEDGVVLSKYAEIHEYINTGHPLYKLGNTNKMILSAWFQGDKVTEIKLNEKVKVGVNVRENTKKYYEGEIFYISDSPDFSPSQVQTKHNQTLMHYLVKIRVSNDGNIKPGMPGEVILLRK